ncbi:hypothetical protein B0J12DRAFT_198960 [Macrophomina phaseolina]|uniref:Uncharacterized protein n=1 Tax=Macrophomina phaseolina TaxID=35725 RepID=A0ABQ8G377_9PEZI|nr:hypothetical protein B0J12DRAFT_198960 [Macrophomina phaseolina]
MEASNKRRRTDDSNHNHGHVDGSHVDNNDNSHNASNGVVELSTSRHPHDNDDADGHHHHQNHQNQQRQPSLETAIASLPASHLQALLRRHAPAHAPLATDILRAYADHAAARHREVQTFDHLSASVWRALNTTASNNSKNNGSRNSGAEHKQEDGDNAEVGDAYRQIRHAIKRISEAARPPAPFATRRNALVTLWRIGRCVCLSADGEAVGRRVVEMLQEGETAFVDAVEEIVEGLSEEEKNVEEDDEGRETFEDKLFELVGLAEERGVFDGLAVAAEKLGLVFDYGDSDENGYMDGHEREEQLRDMFDEGFGGVDFSNEEREARRALADQSQSSGRVYLRILDLIRKIRRTTRIADLFVMRTADDPLTRGVQEQFRGDGEMGRTFIQILSSMSDFEKKRLLDSIDEDMPFGGKIFETALMAKASGIMPALEGCLEALRMPSQSRQ